MCLRIEEKISPIILHTYGKYLLAKKRLVIKLSGNVGFHAIYQYHKYRPHKIIPDYGILIMEEQAVQPVESKDGTVIKKLGFHLESGMPNDTEHITMIIPNGQTDTLPIITPVFFHRSWIQMIGDTDIVVKTFIIPSPSFAVENFKILCAIDAQDDSMPENFNSYITAYNAALRNLKWLKGRLGK